MKLIRHQEQRHSFDRRFLVFFLLISLNSFSSVARATYSVPADRSVVWQENVGVSGDIPTRTSIYTTLSPSGGDDTSVIQTAINSCPPGQVVKLNAGTFNITGLAMKANVVLRGAGMGVTTLHGTSTGANALISFQGSGYSWDLSANPSINLSSGYTKGSTNITTATAHGWQAGDFVVIDQLNNASSDPPVTNVGTDGTCTWCGRANGERSLGQVARVTAVPTTTSAILEIPLYWNYDPKLTPQAVKISGTLEGAGVERLTVDNSASGNTNQSNYGTIALVTAMNCWLYKVEVVGSYVSIAKLYQTYRNTIRGCKFHEGVPATPINGSQYGAGHGYGLWLNPWSSANLIEDNQLYHLSVGIIMNGATSGNVISYNYIHDIYYTDNNWGREAISSHGAHPIMNLIEGNYASDTISSDFYWGSSSHNTYYRNKQAMVIGKTCGTWTVALYKNNRYYNIIGNIFGSSGYEETYEETGNSFLICPGPKIIYMLGYTNPNGSGTGSDPKVATTILRHANWDSVNNGVVWNGSDDHTLPASLYLSGKPNWWGTVQWPCIGPDVTPMYPSIPLNGSPPWDQGTLPVPIFKSFSIIN